MLPKNGDRFDYADGEPLFSFSERSNERRFVPSESPLTWQNAELKIVTML